VDGRRQRHTKRIARAMREQRNRQHRHQHARAARVMMDVQSILRGPVVTIAGEPVAVLTVLIVNMTEMGVDCFALVVRMDDNAYGAISMRVEPHTERRTGGKEQRHRPEQSDAPSPGYPYSHQHFCTRQRQELGLSAASAQAFKAHVAEQP